MNLEELLPHIRLEVTDPALRTPGVRRWLDECRDLIVRAIISEDLTTHQPQRQ